MKVDIASAAKTAANVAAKQTKTYVIPMAVGVLVLAFAAGLIPAVKNIFNA